MTESRNPLSLCWSGSLCLVFTGDFTEFCCIWFKSFTLVTAGKWQLKVPTYAKCLQLLGAPIRCFTFNQFVLIAQLQHIPEWNWITPLTERYINIIGTDIRTERGCIQRHVGSPPCTRHWQQGAHSENIHPCNEPRQEQKNKMLKSKEMNKMVVWDWSG